MTTPRAAAPAMPGDAFEKWWASVPHQHLDGASFRDFALAAWQAASSFASSRAPAAGEAVRAAPTTPFQPGDSVRVVGTSRLYYLRYQLGPDATPADWRGAWGCALTKQGSECVAIHKEGEIEPACYACAIKTRVVTGTHSTSGGMMCADCYAAKIAPECLICEDPYAPKEAPHV